MLIRELENVFSITSKRLLYSENDRVIDHHSINL